MAKNLILPLMVLVLSSVICSNAHLLSVCKFDKVYQFGDSISDTGNLIREFPNGTSTVYGRLPYGSAFSKFTYDGTHLRPLHTFTGRCSNGFLIIDYIAMSAGPPLQPYKNTKANFRHGVNFAVAGSTALPPEVLAAKHNISSPVTNSSLDVQLDWMSTHFNSTCLNQRDCIEKLENALFMVGEIGANDYKYAIFQGKTMDELRSMVPEVVDAIMNGVRKSISFGATRVVVPGNFPIGCLPKSNISSSYDQNRCLNQLNEFAMYHNEQLQKAIDKLKHESPNAVIVYGDYYNAYQSLLQYATSNGFETEKACCGIGGKYNFNSTRMCGAPDVPVCPDPHRYISWDGVNLTEDAYEIMADWLMRDLFTKLNCHF